MSNKKVKLYVKGDILKQDTAKNEEARMRAKLEEEERKLQERRAKQEQQLAYRAQKKMKLKLAKDAEESMIDALTDYERARREKMELKPFIERTRQRIKDLEKQQEQAIAALHKAQHRVAHLGATRDAENSKLNELVESVDGDIIEAKKQRLQNAFSETEEAWERVQKATRKKHRNRDLKKAVKDALR